jgi:hypothetical protein
MDRSKKDVGQRGQQSSGKSELGPVIDPDEPGVLPPETAEDFLHIALEKSNLIETVRLLRDLHGRKAIKSALNNLENRGPTNQLTNIYRHAVELYAIKHDEIPANLMVKLTGVNGRADAVGAERGKLRAARRYVEQDKNALMAARAMAKLWEENRPKGRNVISHLKKINPEV